MSVSTRNLSNFIAVNDAATFQKVLSDANVCILREEKIFHEWASVILVFVRNHAHDIESTILNINSRKYVNAT